MCDDVVKHEIWSYVGYPARGGDDANFAMPCCARRRVEHTYSPK